MVNISIFINEQYHSGILTSRIISVGFLMNGLYYLVTNYIVFTKKTKSEIIAIDSG